MVQTPLGKGVVAAVRNSGRVLVRVQHRAVVFDVSALSLVAATKEERGEARGPAPVRGIRRGRQSAEGPLPGQRVATVDLHGLTVDQALERVEMALNDALLSDVAELRFVHGKGGGRIRAALHRRLKELPPVCSMRIDPANAGVTIVSL